MLPQFNAQSLELFFLCDMSGSMRQDGRVDAMNEAIIEIIPNLKDLSAQNSHLDIYIKAITFANHARWHIKNPTRIEDLCWPRLTNPQGYTALGAGIQLLGEAISTNQLDHTHTSPVIILFTDGAPTDDFERQFQQFMQLFWAKRAIRFAIAIGEHADLDTLSTFVGDKQTNSNKIISVTQAESIIDFIRHNITSVNLNSIDNLATLDSFKVNDIW